MSKSIKVNTIEELLSLAAKHKDGNDFWVELGGIDPKQTKLLSDLYNTDVSKYKRTIDISSVKHVLKRHPEITASDFLHVADIVNNSDAVGRGKNDESVVYIKRKGSVYYYVEYIRKGRKYLTMKTFYKIKSRP